MAAGLYIKLRYRKSAQRITIYIKLRNRRISGLCPSSGVLNNWRTTLRKLDQFPSSSKGGGKLRGLIPLVNYTDRATAVCRRS
jgi:hypothetical protein